ncbi:MAG: hypothetical protein ACPGYV_03330, partial [Phycisphaeraceae bacterium]
MKSGVKHRSSLPGRVLALLLVGCSLLPWTTRAAYISEIDRASVAGQAIELSQVDPLHDYSLLILDANPYSPSAFGRVLDVVSLPAGVGLGGVALITDAPWQDEPTRSRPLEDLSVRSGATSLNLLFDRLLVVVEGRSNLQLLQNPVSDPIARATYQATTTTDWLVLGQSGLDALYARSGHDLDAINDALGIDLPARLIDKAAGRVVARTNAPGLPMDKDVFFSGDPNASQQFEVGDELLYTATLGLNNLPLQTQVPEPAGSVTLGLVAWMT